MKKLFMSAAVIALMASCTQEKGVTVSVSNPLKIDRVEEIVEVSADDILGKLKLDETEEFVITGENNAEVPYQLTADNKIIFPVTVKSEATTSYNIIKGQPSHINTLVYGRQYPERLDDIAWENDKAAYRAYGPALQQTGEKAYGYDVFTKSVSELVVEDRYAMDLDPDTRAMIKQLREEGKKAEADSLANAISYHIDHGNGMDCYAVGPTLGGGTAALMPDSAIVYPYCYRNFEILDNGPLRFTVKLEYNPLTIDGDTTVVETRLIQLDKGSHLNRTTVSYTSLKKDYPIGVGLVLHEAFPDRYSMNQEGGYIAYSDPTTEPKSDNGIIYMGAVFPNALELAKVQLFDKPVSGAIGHVLGINTYQPGDEFEYYWGSAWSKCGFDDERWNSYLEEYAMKVRNPLIVAVK
ncbi:DUF4861 domain-containing protein [Bacteroides caecigallinarum]|uniref:DUF4861 domain-containing protein n=1 Tax=Bacteroides caecigallinarum TaxID=1411144 RepID=UPI001F19BBF1|nr:DUF4861 domain-containing protein [Bacteroides caecigallinarum]MCF2552211.1 DUF4861 domain-containing protein [Bacteroides caecigallinarum]